MKKKNELLGNLKEDIDYVKNSQYRTKVLKSLEGDVKIPTAIAKDSGIMTNHISKVLSELRT